MANKSAFSKFLEDNTKGSLNKVFLGLAAADIAQSDNKLKALLKTLVQLALFKPLIAIGLAGAFAAMGRSIRALVKDTGSLEAALRKLTQIQGLQRSLAPFVGGLQAAKLKVAELVNFAASNNLDLGGVGDAEKDLQAMTHGAYAGANALQAVGDTAAATGNGFKETGGAVAEFYADLREGRPVAAAAERLRQMGVLTDADVESLAALQKTTATSAQVFDAFTKTLEANRGAMKGLAGDVTSVNSAYAAARENLAEKFASPFVASDIENTKNWTAAMNAIAPVVQQVAPFIEKLANGFSTFNSMVAKTLAQSPVVVAILGNMVTVFASLIGVMSGVAAVGLGVWLIGAGAAVRGFAGAIGELMIKLALLLPLSAEASAAMMNFTTTVAVGAGRVGSALAVLSGWLVLLTFVVTAVGVYKNFAEEANNVAKALEDQAKAHRQTAMALEKQIAAARTLREHQEALTKAVQDTSSAQAEYAKALEEQAAIDGSSSKSSLAHIGSFFGLSEEWGKDQGAAAKVAAAEKNVLATKQREKTQRDQVEAMKARGTLSPERAQANIEVARARAELAQNREQAVSLANLSDFAAEFERQKATYGDTAKARDNALTLTGTGIQDRAGGIAADKLARLGLGGESGGGGDVQKQIRDLNQKANEYLQRIEAKIDGSPAPANVPAEYDGT